jgi:predicted metal-dependent phosphotriesterase family hydrolase
MAEPGEQYVVDEGGTRIGVILRIGEYRKILTELEELASIRAYDAAKASDETPVPLEQVLAAIEREQR